MKILLVCCLIMPLQSQVLEEAASLRIVGGTNVKPAEFPYQVSIKIKRRLKPDWHFCGGAIFNEKTIITAAHCVRKFPIKNPSGLQVVAGHLKLRTKSTHAQTSNVSSILLHPKYKSNNHHNDIAILVVDPPFEFDNYVSPLPLPTKSQNFTFTDCVVTGWGATKLGEQVQPDVLQKVTVTIVSDEDCQAKYANRTFKPTESMICAGEEGKDSCQGDSGGPLACHGVLAGIVSWGYKCALADYPGVYTETSYFIGWIINKAVMINSAQREI